MAKRKKQPYNGGGRELTLEEKSDWIIKVKEVKCTMMTGGGARRATTPPFKVQYKKLKANHKDEWVPAERDAGEVVRHSGEKRDQGASDEI